MTRLGPWRHIVAYKCCLNIWWLWGYCNKHLFEVKTATVTYWATFENIELLFILTSGHTGVPGPISSYILHYTVRREKIESCSVYREQAYKLNGSVSSLVSKINNVASKIAASSERVIITCLCCKRFLKMGQSWPLFVYFCSFLNTIPIIQIEKA